MPYRTRPELSGRHPFEVFMLILALVTGIPALLGIAPEPGSIEQALPNFASFGWRLVLVVGSVLSLSGIFWGERATGLILEQLGLAFVGITAVIYSVAAVSVVGVAASIPAGIIFGFGAACLTRWRQIQKIIDEVEAAEKQRNGHS